jgi:hypothetical protein
VSLKEKGRVVAEKELRKSNWKAYFEAFAKRTHFPQLQQVLVVDITYDPRADVLAISLGNRRHLIRQPKSIFVEDAVGTLMRFKIIDADNLRHIVQLQKPMADDLSSGLR